MTKLNFKVKKFTNEIDLNKFIESKLTKDIDFNNMLRDSECKNKVENNIKYEGFYYDYKNNKGEYKDLVYITLTDNNIYYLIYAKNKNINISTLWYNFKNYYNVTEGFQDLYTNASYKTSIVNFKWNIEMDIKSGDSSLTDRFNALLRIEELKELCINCI